MYRAHFCGLCNRLRQEYGLHTRFLVNRDAAFLSLLGNALDTEPAPARLTTCCNPLGKPRWVMQDGDAAAFAAAVTLCGLKVKLDDEITDRRPGPLTFAIRGLQALMPRAFSKAEDHLHQISFPVEALHEALAEQSSLEQTAARTGSPDLDTLSGPTAFSFGQILAHTCAQAAPRLQHIGESLGRIIYALDAWKDRRHDQRARQFNPFLLQPQLAGILPSILSRELDTLHTHFHSLPLRRNRHVLELILGPNLQRTCFSLLHERDARSDSPPQKNRRPSPSRSRSASWMDACCDAAICCDGPGICAPDCACDSCCDSGCDCT